MRLSPPLGKRPDEVVELDLVTLNAAFECLARVEAKDKAERGWTLWHAAHCTQDGFKEWAARWETESMKSSRAAAGNRAFEIRNGIVKGD